MGQQIDGKNPGRPNATQRQRRPWSPPRVILTELQSTYHQVGANPLDKNVFTADGATPQGSIGS